MGLFVVVVAGVVADLVLWPRERLPQVAAVNQLDYFSAAFIASAAHFRGPQTQLAIAALLTLVIVPLALALTWPRGLRDGAQGRWWSRWVDRRSGVLFGRGGAGAFVAVATVVSAIALLCALPFEFVGFLRARDIGLVVQGFGGWLWDWLLATVLALAGVAVLALLARVLLVRLGHAWWVAFGACLVVLAIGFTMFAPLVVEPLFGKFTAVGPGALRSEVDQIARESGVRAGEIYTVDAAHRTTGANAYVSGLGGTKRVVVYDTLLKDFSPAQRRQVLAHEFGHARHRDVTAGLVWFSFVALVAMFAIDLMARGLALRRGVAPESPAFAAMLIAATVLAVAVSQPAANAWSRKIEARADAFAIDVTGRPADAISLERKLTVQNVMRPQPPAVLQALFGTHPTAMQRIGMAVSAERASRAAERSPGQASPRRRP